ARSDKDSKLGRRAGGTVVESWQQAQADKPRARGALLRDAQAMVHATRPLVSPAFGGRASCSRG
ncbi:MAG TPA: hypothetical protein PLH36_08590, partial [Armatimonadota bacterium]|nr:hypothetical protein [Armatimonadota bacterium]